MNNVCEIWTEELKEGMLVETPDGWSEVTYLEWDSYEDFLSYRTENEHRVDYHPSAVIIVSIPEDMLNSMPVDQQILMLARIFIHRPTQLNQLRVSVAMDVYREGQDNG